MQNLKSLNNLIQKPVMGKNDDFMEMTGHKKVVLYSYRQEMAEKLREIDEPMRKVLSREIMTDSKQS